MVTVRTIAEIRDALLSYWAAEYLANGEVLLTAPGSDAYLLAGMIAIVQNACDVQALQVSRDILPDQASNGAIERFGYVYGVSRTPAAWPHGQLEQLVISPDLIGVMRYRRAGRMPRARRLLRVAPW